MRGQEGIFMEIDMSPAEYAAPRREEIARIERFCSKPPEEITIGGIVLCIFVGLFIGCLIGLPVGIAYAVIFYGDTAYGKCILACAILGAIIGLCFYIYDKVSSENYRQQRLREKKKLEKEIAQYTAQFEEKAKERCAQFSKKPLTLQATNQMLAYFKENIDSAPRGKHIEKIHEKYCFIIYSDHISYQQKYGEGKIDFYLERLKNLEKPLDQAALAQTIASGIKQSISLGHSQKYQLDIDYTYTPESVTATLTYTADNGYYQPVQDWV